MNTWRNLVLACLLVLTPLAAAPAAPELDRLTPSDAEVVVQINVRQLLQTPIVKKHALDPLKVLLQRNDEVKQLLAVAGLDPLKDIDTICLCMSGNPLSGAKLPLGNPLSGGKLLAVVRGSFDVDRVRKAAEEYARKHPGRLKSSNDPTKGWEIICDHKSLYAAFAGDKTLVMTTSKEDTAAVVARAGQAPQLPNKAMQAALDHLKGGESVWMAMVATEEIKQLLKNDDSGKDFAAALQSITGALELTDDARLAVVVHTNSPEAAAQIKGKIDEVMPLLAFVGAGKEKSGRIVKDVIDGIKVKTEKNDVSIRLQITDAQIEKARKADR
jgi:hypothetical protein